MYCCMKTAMAACDSGCLRMKAAACLLAGGGVEVTCVGAEG
jgi:hypothetical protein